MNKTPEEIYFLPINDAEKGHIKSIQDMARHISNILKEGQDLQQDAKDYLIKAMAAISDGASPDEAFKFKLARGQNRPTPDRDADIYFHMRELIETHDMTIGQAALEVAIHLKDELKLTKKERIHESRIEMIYRRHQRTIDKVVY